jgi:release factor glutamine methyltransferase
MFMTYNQAFYDLLNKLQPLYDAQEAAAIGHEVLLHITGLDKLQRLMQKDVLFTEAQSAQFEVLKAALLNGAPMQYVLGVAWFMGQPYKVNKYTLIPRPETEELVQWITDEHKDQSIRILDIGTGSGCIPISLRRALPLTAVHSCDISPDALVIAKENADRLDAKITLQQINFLNHSQTDTLGIYDVLVSNPPYIPVAEKEALHKNVKDFEPSLALFVPDSDPLVFYRAIALFGLSHLEKHGCIYCELHRDYAMQTKTLFEVSGYKNVTIREDMNGNLRMLKACIV